MPLAELLPFITGAGGALVVLFLWVMDLRRAYREEVTKWERVATDAVKLLTAVQQDNKSFTAALEERNRIDAEQLQMVRAGLIDELGRPTRPPARRRT